MKTLILILFYVLSINLVIAQFKTSESNRVSTEVKLKKLISLKIDTLLKEINLARSNPKEYGILNHLESERLDTIINKEPFILNTNLCRLAQSYSDKLMKNKYNSNSVSCVHSNLGYNESICFSTSLSTTIYQLIEDKDTDNLTVKDVGHRQHLLSMNNKDTKIGIGISHITNLNWYVVVIVTER